MNKIMNKVTWSIGLLGILALNTPVARAADDERGEQTQARLERQLRPGQTPNFYREKLVDLGWQITAVNRDDSDYAEYEVVQGDQTYEVHIHLDGDTGRATEVNVLKNLEKAEATERALERSRRTARGSHYSDRDRAKTAQLIKELEALPVGRTREFYRNALKKQGYQILGAETDTDEKLALEAVKNGQSVVLTINFDEETGKSIGVNALTPWWEVEENRRARGREGERTTAGRAADDERWEQSRAQLERQLRPGQTRNFYREKLADLGWQITAVNRDDSDYAEYEIVQGDRTYEVHVHLDGDTGRAAEVNVLKNLEKAEATERALERNAQAAR